MTMKDRIAAGMLFSDMCEGMPEERAKAKRLMLAYNNSSPDDFKGRMELLQDILGKPAKAYIEPPFGFCYGTHINFLGGAYLNMGCTFVDDGEIEIGDNALFGPCVTIATVSHPVAPKMRGYMYCDKVVIGKNCWIGAGAVICPGANIGDNTVIGAGSVVTGTIPANVIAVGNPCKVLREITEEDSRFYGGGRPITEEDLAEERALSGMDAMMPPPGTRP